MNFNRTVIIPFILLLLCAAGCGTARHAQPEPSGGDPVEYRIVYLVHGDGDYLYHDREGTALQADREAVGEAAAVAGRAQRGEVFIFHLKPERRFLGLFPRKDRVMLHYRNGMLLNRSRYSPDGDLPFGREAELVALLQDSSVGDIPRTLLYFGHEIPEGERAGYHRSRPEVPFGLSRFVEGTAALGPSWDLVVLSTCNNGTPQVASALAAVADWLLASPQNLHLSHIDTEKLLSWEAHPGSAGEVAGSLAEETFRRLEKEVQTEISLAVYPLHRSAALDSLSRAVRSMEMASDSVGEPGSGGQVDCADLPLHAGRTDPEIGLRVWYRGPMFGRRAAKESHSGWGCRVPAPMTGK